LEKYSKFFILFFFIAFGYWGIINHEIWLDEAHHFVLARDSKTLRDLYFNNRYEGHPLLWNYLLWLLCKIITTVFAMQFLHLTIATLTAAIMLWHAPFKIYQKVLLCFSYFLFYEYAIISRNYAISILLIFLCLVQINKARKNYNLILLLLSLLANTHLFSLVFSVAIFSYLLSSNYNRVELYKQKQNYFFILLYIAALLFALSFAKVPSDHFLLNYNTDNLLSIKRIGKAFSICWKSLFHLQPLHEFNLWNKNWLIEYNKNIGTLAALIAWIIPYLMFKEHKKILLFFYGISLGICAFVFMSPLIVAVRHSGFIFIAFLISYWLLTANNEGVQNKKSEYIFGIILVQLCISSVIMFKQDYNYGFSGGKKTSTFLTTFNLKNKTEIICQNTAMPVISAYTGKKYIEINNLEKGSFCHWNIEPFLLNTSQVQGQLVKYFDTQKVKSVIYIAQDSFNLKLLNITDGLNYTLVNSFTNSIVKQENYYIYFVEKVK
jgi:hypothetical protein